MIKSNGGEIMEGKFEYYVNSDTVNVKYAKGAPSVTGREFHDYCEFLMYFEGNSRLISKNVQLTLMPGDIVMIPKYTFHQFVVENHDTYTRCVLGFYDLPILKELIDEVFCEVKVLQDPDKRIVRVFEDLMEIASSDLSDAEKRVFADSALAQLLVLCKKHQHGAVSVNINISPTIHKAMRYIDENFTQVLTVEDIAKAVHVSKSTLAHNFSKELKIPIYRYISKKRLSFAGELIKKGEPMTVAAEKSGFNDYSCFYRMYKRYYNKKG